jgi:hypothetical protein
VLGRNSLVNTEPKFIFVAVMDAQEKAVSHIHGLLRSAGIRFTPEGEVISELCIEETDVDRALPLLRAERTAGRMISVTPFTSS